MKCPYCGWDNPDEATVCEMCEMPLNLIEKQKPTSVRDSLQSPTSEQHRQRTYNPRERHLDGIGCPNCGMPMEGCTPLVKTTISSTGGGYGFFSGCCGMVLLGPFGLLCGLKGKRTTSSSQTWWACRKCGKEFLERDTAKEVMDTAIERNAGITFIICLIWEFLFTCYGYNAWVRNIAMLMIIGIWFGISGISTELTGYTIQQLFTNEERWNFYKRSALYAIGSFLLGIVIGAKVMQFLFT